MHSKYSQIQRISIFGLVIIIGFGYVLSANAQEPEDIWSVPVNLSNSGGTTSPAIVIDAEGITHVVWQDEYRGSVYNSFDGTQWSVPVALSFPFSSPISNAQPGEQALPGIQPTFIADSSGLVHAFWIDDQFRLFYSFVSSIYFGDPGAWSGAAQLAESAVDFDAIVDSDGRIHLAYVRNLENTDFPAGIYHRVTNDSGLSWNLPTPLYNSPYFRALTNTEANIDLAIDSNGETLFASWDNQPRKQVYSAVSTDSGISWGQPILIDSPTEDKPASRPMNIQTVGFNDDTLLFWQDGDTAGSCAQYFQISTDKGNTWGERQRVLGDVSGCPEDIHFFPHRDLLTMMATIQGQVYLLAWDGNQWSNLQPQRELSGFEDPGTYDQVIFDCHQPTQDMAGNLIVVGCDLGVGGDIWITQRAIGDTVEWFPPPSAWRDPELVTSANTPIADPILLSDSQGRLHAFWVQQVSTTTNGSAAGARYAIYYSRKETEIWTRPGEVLQSPNGITRQPAATIDTDGNLFVVWSGGEAGEIFFSRAIGARANSPSEWADPLAIPSVRQAGSSPDIVVSPDGTINVAYAIPLNENRGLYIVQSSDGGLSWSEPVQAFDAVQEGWEMVDQPHLALSGKTINNLSFGDFSLPGGIGSLGLYATRSTDGGATWSNLESVTAHSLTWNELTQASNGFLHRTWMEQSNFGASFQHEVSTDFGNNWSVPVSISSIGTSRGNPAITTDLAGQLYLLQAIEDASQQLSLVNWFWDGSGWALQENLVIGDGSRLAVENISAAVSPEGRLAVIFSGTNDDLVTDSPVYWIYETDRQLELPDVLPTAFPEPTIQMTETPIPNNPGMPSVTPTVVLPSLQPNNPGRSQSTQSNTWLGLGIAGVLGIFIAGAVFVIRLMGMRR